MDFSKYKKIGLVVAMDKEVIPFLKGIGQNEIKEKIANYEISRFFVKDKEIILIKSGIGEIYASSSTQLLITKYNVDLILNFGVSGSLDKKVGVLSTVLVKGVVHYDFDLSKIDNVVVGQYPNYSSPIIDATCEAFNIVANYYSDIEQVICASADKFVEDKEVKEHLKNTYNASVCDMECAGVLLTCKNNNIPQIIIKTVSDGEGGVEEYNKRVNEATQKYISIVKDIIGI